MALVHREFEVSMDFQSQSTCKYKGFPCKSTIMYPNAYKGTSLTYVGNNHNTGGSSKSISFSNVK